MIAAMTAKMWQKAQAELLAILPDRASGEAIPIV